jgi:endoglucanase
MDECVKNEGINAALKFARSRTFYQMIDATTNWGWGGWFDAGDWDRNSNHIFGSQQLLLVYELSPNKFYDGQLNIPQSGNHIPDIIDEARWTIDFFRRLTGPTGGVSGGIECTTPTAPDGSWRDRNKTWYAYKEEPKCTILTAAACAQLAYCLELAGDTNEKTALISQAQSFYNWATNPANLQPGDAAAIRDHRMLAAAWLYKVTGDVNYQNQYKTDNLVTTSTSALASSGSYDQQMAVWTYITTNQPTIDTTLKNKQIQATYNWAGTVGTTPAAGRSCRMGGNYWQPTTVGAIVTTPQVLPLIVAYHLSGNLNYLDYVYTSCDYTLGGNALNMTWITGAGLYGAEKAPLHSLNHDAYTDGVVPIIPGIVNYGPMNLGFSKSWSPSGPWSTSFVYQSFWPTADPWTTPYIFPTHELYTDNPYTIMNNEYTVWQNIAPAAAAYGYLWAINSNPGDIDGDNEVNLADFAALADDWGRADCDYDNGFCGKADLNLDGNVDLRDIGSFCGLFLR